MTEITHDLAIERGTLLPTCLVLLACICFGTIPYFAKSLTDAGMASYSVAFYRYGLSAFVLRPLFLRVLAAQPKIVAWGVLSGVSVWFSRGSKFRAQKTGNSIFFVEAKGS